MAASADIRRCSGPDIRLSTFITHVYSFSGPDIHSWLRPRVTRRSCGHYRQRRKLTLRVSMVCAPMRARGALAPRLGVCRRPSWGAGGGRNRSPSSALVHPASRCVEFISKPRLLMPYTLSTVDLIESAFDVSVFVFYKGATSLSENWSKIMLVCV